MRLHGQIFAVAGVITLSVGCGGKAYNPWLAPEPEFRSGVRRIALAQVDAPPQLEDADPVRVLFDSLLTERLQGAGFTVIPSTRAIGLWVHAIDSAGGYYNRFTGQADTVKAAAINDYVVGRLAAEDSADAVLYPAVVIARANFSGHKAKWDGTSQSIEGFGSRLLRALGGMTQEGYVPALSLRVYIVSTAGRRMYLNQGGIEVWAKPGDKEPIPRGLLFLDPERNTAAVALALKAIVEPEEAR